MEVDPSLATVSQFLMARPLYSRQRMTQLAHQQAKIKSVCLTNSMDSDRSSIAKALVVHPILKELPSTLAGALPVPKMLE